MFKRSIKIKAAIAASAVLFTACGSNAEMNDQVQTPSTVEQNSYADENVYDFPQEMKYEILRCVQYGITKEYVIEIEGKPAESGIRAMMYHTDVNGYSADLHYLFMLPVPGEDVEYRNVSGASYSFDIDGLTDLQMYNEYKALHKLYTDRYGNPSQSFAFISRGDDVIDVGDFPVMDESFTMDAYTDFNAQFNSGSVTISFYFGKSSDGTSRLEIKYLCDNPLSTVNI